MIYFLLVLVGILLGFVLCSIGLYGAMRRGKLAMMYLNEKSATVDTFGDAAYLLKEGGRLKYGFHEAAAMNEKHRKFT